MRTIPEFEDYVEPIEEILNNELIPTLFGQEQPFPAELRNLFTLTPSQGGLGIISPKSESPHQYINSVLLSKSHVDAIKTQSVKMVTDETAVENAKKHIQDGKVEVLKANVERIDSELQPNIKRMVDQARDKGASSWLNAIPLEEQGLCLNKEEFRDALRMRYDIPLVGLPSHCVCGEKFTINHSQSCKKGGFVSQRHDGIRDLLTSMLSKVCNNVQSEPHLIPIENETFQLRSANVSSEARLDIKAGSFWSRGVTAFFDVRVTHVNSTTNQNKPTEKIFQAHENEKKRQYLQRVLDVEHGHFTPLVFGTNGGMGAECSLFVKTLAEKLSAKQNETYSTIISWLRTRLSFEILRSVNLCLRGSRVPFRKRDECDMIEDFKLNVAAADIMFR